MWGVLPVPPVLMDEIVKGWTADSPQDTLEFVHPNRCGDVHVNGQATERLQVEQNAGSALEDEVQTDCESNVLLAESLIICR